MGFFTRTAMDMLMKTTHPEINRRQCWNLHPHRKPCTECKDICPYGEQIFTRPNLVKDWDPCTECGGAQVVLTFTAGGQVQHDLFVQGKVGQCLPCEGRNAGAHHGIFAGGLFAADPDGVIVGIGGRGRCSVS